MHSSTCESCGKVFEHAKRERRFCSKSCSAKGTAPQRIANGGGGGGRKTGENVACEICGKVFYRKEWERKRGFGRFCGHECRRVWLGRNSVTRPCSWCGKAMTMSPFRAGIQQFCSRECYIEGGSKTAIDRWHNGRRVRVNDDGYILIYQPDHPSVYADGWMLEHRYVAEQMIGRPLETMEHVHHINSVRDDNRPENLAVLSPSEHRVITNLDYHAKLKAQLAELEAYKQRYGPLEENQE